MYVLKTFDGVIFQISDAIAVKILEQFDKGKEKFNLNKRIITVSSLTPKEEFIEKENERLLRLGKNEKICKECLTQHCERSILCSKCYEKIKKLPEPKKEDKPVSKETREKTNEEIRKKFGISLTLVNKKST